MNRQKLIELRCKAWGITEDEYYCNQCSDFSLEDMARAYRRGKNKGRAELEAQIEKMKKYIKACWIEENLNDYSSYITNNSDEFRDLVKELNDEVRNGR